MSTCSVYIVTSLAAQTYDSDRNRSIPLTLIVNLDVPDEVILSRISDRYVHLPSGRVYNMSYNKPNVPGFDDITGEALTKRPDDNPVSRVTLPPTQPFTL